MLYLNLEATLNANSGSNSAIVASSPGLFPLVIESLLLIVDLRSSPRNSFQRSVQLKFREKGTQQWNVIAENSLTNKGTIYREDLLKYLTINPTFRLSPDHEIAISLVGSPLSGNDTIKVLGSAYRPTPDSVGGNAVDNDGSVVTQNFITANYSVPARDQLQNPSLLNGWSVYESSRPPQYYKDQIGRIHLSGLLKAGNVSTGTVIFVLPEQLRPLQLLTLMVTVSGGSAQFNIHPDGSCTVGVGTNAYISLDGVSFLAA
jgi:hypothetical protein